MSLPLKEAIIAFTDELVVKVQRTPKGLRLIYHPLFLTKKKNKWEKGEEASCQKEIA